MFCNLLTKYDDCVCARVGIRYRDVRPDDWRNRTPRRPSREAKQAAGESTGDAVKDAGKATGKAAKKVGKTTADVAEDAAKGNGPRYQEGRQRSQGSGDAGHHVGGHAPTARFTRGKTKTTACAEHGGIQK